MNLQTLGGVHWTAVAINEVRVHMAVVTPTNRASFRCSPTGVRRLSSITTVILLKNSVVIFSKDAANIDSSNQLLWHKNLTTLDLDCCTFSKLSTWDKLNLSICFPNPFEAAIDIAIEVAVPHILILVSIWGYQFEIFKEDKPKQSKSLSLPYQTSVLQPI